MEDLFKNALSFFIEKFDYYQLKDKRNQTKENKSASEGVSETTLKKEEKSGSENKFETTPETEEESDSESTSITIPKTEKKNDLENISQTIPKTEEMFGYTNRETMIAIKMPIGNLAFLKKFEIARMNISFYHDGFYPIENKDKIFYNQTYISTVDKFYNYYLSKYLNYFDNKADKDIGLRWCVRLACIDLAVRNQLRNLKDIHLDFDKDIKKIKNSHMGIVEPFNVNFYIHGKSDGEHTIFYKIIMKEKQNPLKTK